MCVRTTVVKRAGRDEPRRWPVDAAPFSGGSDPRSARWIVMTDRPSQYPIGDTFAALTGQTTVGPVLSPDEGVEDVRTSGHLHV